MVTAESVCTYMGRNLDSLHFNTTEMSRAIVMRMQIPVLLRRSGMIFRTLMVVTRDVVHRLLPTN